jgi:hypothetical protein
MRDLEEKALIIEVDLKESLTDLLNFLTDAVPEYHRDCVDWRDAWATAEKLASRVRTLREKSEAIHLEILCARREEPDEDYNLPF